MDCYAYGSQAFDLIEHLSNGEIDFYANLVDYGRSVCVFIVVKIFASKHNKLIF